MASGRIKTKSVYDPIEYSDGIRILVTRYHPRIKGFKKGIGYNEWLKELSPVASALKKFKAGKMAEQQFGKSYIAYFGTSEGAQEKLDHIRELLKSGKTITLLCYEPEGDFCHRHLLKEYLANEQIDRR